MTFFSRTGIIVSTLVLIAAFAVPVMPVQAQGLGQSLKSGVDAAAPDSLKGGETDPATIIGAIIGSLMGLVGVLLLLYLLYGGFLWMTAGGEKGGVEKAQLVIKNAVIGIVIVALSYAIASFVIDQLVKTTQGPGGPVDQPSPT